jgi:hypothetical protein
MMLSPASRTQLPYGRAVMVAFLAAIFFLIPIQAQQQPPADHPQLTSKDVSDEEMENFVAAWEAVEIIRLDLQKKMAGVQDADRATELQQEANKRMVAAVQENDFEPQRYNMLSNAISNDKELLDRFQQTQKQRAAEKQKQQEKN